MSGVGRRSSLRTQTASPASVQFSCGSHGVDGGCLQRPTAGLGVLVALIVRHEFDLDSLRGRQPLQIGAAHSVSMCTTNSGELSAAASLTSDSSSGSSSSTMIRPLDGVKEMSLKILLLKPV